MENLIKKAKEEKTLDWKESIDLVQYLLDTEKVTEYPEFEQLCNYYITEGLCYYVPSWQLINWSTLFPDVQLFVYHVR